MAMTSIDRLAEAIGYPDRVPAGARSAVFLVDGIEVNAREDSRRVVLSSNLDVSDEWLPTAAEYAAGRMLGEEAVLAFDPRGAGAILWQEAPANSSQREFLMLFETFVDSCDWWQTRVKSLGGERAELPDSMVIRP